MEINKVMLYGNLTRDPELRYLENAEKTPLATFTMAVNSGRSAKNKDGDVAFVFVSVFGKQADAISQYLVKGSPVFVDGRLRQDNWEKDGQKHSMLKVVANSVQFGPKKTADPAAADASGNGTGNEPKGTEKPKDDLPF